MRDLDHLLTLPFVLIAPGNTGDIRGLMDPRLEAMSRSRFVQVSVPHFALVPALVASSHAIAFVPKRLVTMEGPYAVDVYDLPVPTDRFEIGMLWHQRSHRDPASIWLREVFVEAASS